MEELQSQYEKLTELIKNCVKKREYSVLEEQKRLLVIAVNEELLIRRFLENLRESCPKAEIVFVAQPVMCSILEELVGTGNTIIRWEGAYTMKLAEKLEEELDMGLFDSFLYFSGQSINLRNRNIMEIAEAFGRKYGMKVYGIDGVSDLYEYEHAGVYNRAIELYLGINNLIGEYLSEFGEE